MVVPHQLGKVIEGLAARPEVEAILLGGSRANGESADKDSDWDLYVFVTADVPVDARQGLLGPLTTRLELGNQFWETEDNGELNDGTAFDLVYRNLDAFTDAVARVVEGFQASTGYTTCLWANLSSSHILFDRLGRAAAAQARFQVAYPRALQEAVVAKNWPLVGHGIPNYRDQVAKALKRGDWVAAQHRLSAYLASVFDLVFAANGRPHPGEKRLAAASAQLPSLPSDWGQLLGAIDRANQGARADLVRSLSSLSSALGLFLIRQGLLKAPEPRTKPATERAPKPQEPAPAPRGPLTVYTDGGCIGNPGKGAWAYLVDDGQGRAEDTGGDALTTNNKMELQAVIEALSAISQRPDWKDRPIVIHTDSQYVRNGITAWIKTWAANGWKTASKEPVKNQDLWMELQRWDQSLHPQWKWVKGHAGNVNNERCDALVRRTMEQM